MAWVGIPYELIGPDGTRVVVGNSDAAKADGDYIGWLDPESGVTGLLDRASIRESSTDLVERDGASHGAFYLSRRSGTMQGILGPANLSFDPVLVANAESKLKRATRALRSDLIVRWTPPNDSTPRQLRCRVQDGPRITGRRPKQWQVTLVSTDVYVLASNESSVTITPGAAAGELGVANPETDPETSALNVSGQQFVVNQGDGPTWPRFRIDGPIVNPSLVNQTTGQTITLSYTLNAGEWLDVYPERGRVLLGGTADRYGAVVFASTSWWQLAPGSNDVRLQAFSFSAPPALLTVYWKHAWE